MHLVGDSSSSSKPTKRTKKTSKRQQQDRASRSVVTKVGGAEAAKELQENWKKMDTKDDGLEWQLSKGVVIALTNQGMSQMEIRALLGVGGYKLI